MSGIPGMSSAAFTQMPSQHGNNIPASHGDSQHGHASHHHSLSQGSFAPQSSDTSDHSHQFGQQPPSAITASQAYQQENDVFGYFSNSSYDMPRGSTLHQQQPSTSVSQGYHGVGGENGHAQHAGAPSLNELNPGSNSSGRTQTSHHVNAPPMAYAPSDLVLPSAAASVASPRTTQSIDEHVRVHSQYAGEPPQQASHSLDPTSGGILSTVLPQNGNTPHHGVSSQASPSSLPQQQTHSNQLQQHQNSLPQQGTHVSSPDNRAGTTPNPTQPPQNAQLAHAPSAASSSTSTFKPQPLFTSGSGGPDLHTPPLYLPFINAFPHGGNSSVLCRITTPISYHTLNMLYQKIYTTKLPILQSFNTLQQLNASVGANPKTAQQYRQQQTTIHYKMLLLNDKLTLYYILRQLLLLVPTPGNRSVNQYSSSQTHIPSSGSGGGGVGGESMSGHPQHAQMANPIAGLTYYLATHHHRFLCSSSVTPPSAQVEGTGNTKPNANVVSRAIHPPDSQDDLLSIKLGFTPFSIRETHDKDDNSQAAVIWEPFNCLHGLPGSGTTSLTEEQQCQLAILTLHTRYQNAITQRAGGGGSDAIAPGNGDSGNATGGDATSRETAQHQQQQVALRLQSFLLSNNVVDAITYLVQHKHYHHALSIALQYQQMSSTDDSRQSIIFPSLPPLSSSSSSSSSTTQSSSSNMVLFVCTQMMNHEIIHGSSLSQQQQQHQHQSHGQISPPTLSGAIAPLYIYHTLFHTLLINCSKLRNSHGRWRLATEEWYSLLLKQLTISSNTVCQHLQAALQRSHPKQQQQQQQHGDQSSTTSSVTGATGDDDHDAAGDGHDAQGDYAFHVTPPVAISTYIATNSTVTSVLNPLAVATPFIIKYWFIFAQFLLQQQVYTYNQLDHAMTTSFNHTFHNPSPISTSPSHVSSTMQLLLNPMLSLYTTMATASQDSTGNAVPSTTGPVENQHAKSIFFRIVQQYQRQLIHSIPFSVIHDLVSLRYPDAMSSDGTQQPQQQETTTSLLLFMSLFEAIAPNNLTQIHRYIQTILLSRLILLHLGLLLYYRYHHHFSGISCLILSGFGHLFLEYLLNITPPPPTPLHTARQESPQTPATPRANVGCCGCGCCSIAFIRELHTTLGELRTDADRRFVYHLMADLQYTNDVGMAQMAQMTHRTSTKVMPLCPLQSTLLVPPDLSMSALTPCDVGTLLQVFWRAHQQHAYTVTQSSSSPSSSSTEHDALSLQCEASSLNLLQLVMSNGHTTHPLYEYAWFLSPQAKMFGTGQPPPPHQYEHAQPAVASSHQETTHSPYQQQQQQPPNHPGISQDDQKPHSHGSVSLPPQQQQPPPPQSGAQPVQQSPLVQMGQPPFTGVQQQQQQQQHDYTKVFSPMQDQYSVEPTPQHQAQQNTYTPQQQPPQQKSPADVANQQRPSQQPSSMENYPSHSLAPHTSQPQPQQQHAPPSHLQHQAQNVGIGHGNYQHPPQQQQQYHEQHRQPQPSSGYPPHRSPGSTAAVPPPPMPPPQHASLQLSPTSKATQLNQYPTNGLFSSVDTAMIQQQPPSQTPSGRNYNDEMTYATQRLENDARQQQQQQEDSGVGSYWKSMLSSSSSLLNNVSSSLASSSSSLLSGSTHLLSNVGTLIRDSTQPAHRRQANLEEGSKWVYDETLQEYVDILSPEYQQRIAEHHQQQQQRQFGGIDQASFSPPPAQQQQQSQPQPSQQQQQQQQQHHFAPPPQGQGHHHQDPSAQPRQEEAYTLPPSHQELQQYQHQQGYQQQQQPASHQYPYQGGFNLNSYPQ